jgi:hypothetical protein
MSHLPERHSQRRLIIVLDVVDYDGLEIRGDYELFHRPDIAVMKWPAESSDALADRLERQGLAVPGAVLLQSPYYADDYAAEEGCAEHFAQQKIAIFSRLCQLLGARRVTAEVIKDTEKGFEITASAGAGRGGIGGSVSGGYEGIARVAESMAWSDEYTGHTADVDAALALLSSTNLDRDPPLRSLVEARGLTKNAHVSRVLTISLTNESRKTFELALSLVIPETVSASGTFRRQQSRMATYVVTYNVLF